MPLGSPSTPIFDRVLRGGSTASRAPSTYHTRASQPTPHQAPTHYLDLLPKGFHVHGYRCGAQVVAAQDILLGSMTVAAKGSGGTVRGPADNGDTRRVLVDFATYHTALNVLPHEVTLFCEYPSQCPKCGLALPDVPKREIKKHRPATGLLRLVSTTTLGARYYRMWRVWLSVVRPDVGEIVLNAIEGELPAPDDDEDDPPPPPPPEEEDDDVSPEAGGGGGGGGGADPDVEAAEEGFAPPPPELPEAEPDVPPSGVPLERNDFYDRFPEVRPTRAAMRALQEENERLKRELEELRGGGGGGPTGGDGIGDVDADAVLAEPEVVGEA